MTIGRLHADVTEGDIASVSEWMQENAVSFAMGIERGGVNFKLHMQLIVKVVTTSPTMLKNLIIEAIGWLKVDRIKLCAKELAGEGVHTWTGMIGYVTKDTGEGHSKLFSKGVSDEDIEAGRELYAALGAPNKNIVLLGQANLIDRANMYYKFKYGSSRLGVGFMQTVMKMLKTGQYRLASSWASLGRAGTGLDMRRLDLIWRLYESMDAFTMDHLAEVIYSPEGKARYVSDLRSLASELDITMAGWVGQGEQKQASGSIYEAFEEHVAVEGRIFMCKAAKLVAFSAWAKAAIASGKWRTENGVFTGAERYGEGQPAAAEGAVRTAGAAPAGERPVPERYGKGQDELLDAGRTGWGGMDSDEDEAAIPAAMSSPKSPCADDAQFLDAFQQRAHMTHIPEQDTWMDDGEAH